MDRNGASGIGLTAGLGQPKQYRLALALESGELPGLLALHIEDSGSDDASNEIGGSFFDNGKSTKRRKF